ncbi:MAG TPA: sodium:calcium antiporter, partial [Anaerolineae bacterium]|nr:sodium:calcium antiporter [Anaerolineae bacterium]
MTIFLAILAMLFGFAALYYGAEWLVAGAISIAKHLHISKVVAGVILVAFGTSAPELFVNSIAAVRGEASFALSNISGSNLANLLIGFGSCAILSQLPIQNRKFRVEFAAYTVAPLVMFIIMFLNGSTLPGWSALLLLAGFAYYIYLTKSRMHTDNAEDEAQSDMPLIVGILWFIVGITLLYVGGEVTVRQAVKIGEALNISE